MPAGFKVQTCGFLRGVILCFSAVKTHGRESLLYSYGYSKCKLDQRQVDS